MNKAMRGTSLAIVGMTLLGGCASMQPGPKDMTFFVTSKGTGKGADLGGLDGADAHCQALARAAGAGDRTWRAYLSTQAPALNDPKVVNARDRIGTGPWQNAKGVVIARSVDDLHSASTNVTKDTSLDEKGQAVKGRTERARHADGVAPRRHRVSGRAVLRHDLRQLDQGRQGRLGDRGPLRSRGAHRQRVGDLVEFVASDPRLRPGRIGQHRRRGAVLLRRPEVTAK